MVLAANAAPDATTTSSTTSSSRSYQVLYYKRKNKVHKSKGVSKCDGHLTVAPAPSFLVTLVEDEGKSKVYSGIQRDVAKQAFGELSLQEDDIVVLGQYEVQIVSLLSSSSQEHDAENVVNSSSKATTVHQRRPAKPLQSKNKPLPFAKRPFATAVTQSLKPMSSSQSWLANRRPPAQPKRNADDSEKGSDEDETTLKQKSMPTKTNSLYKKRKITTLARVAAPTDTKVPSNNFPGAIGSIVVPPSILKVLRPHQTEGVAFFWNCLTGASPALQEAARDCGTSTPLAGGILADEMGLGKTLVTIATLFALHRRQKEKRFIIVCPSSLVSNWGKEFDKWIGKASQPKRVVVRRGGETGLRMIRAFVPLKPHQSEVLIISYDLFRMNASLLNQAKEIGLLVVDEGHRLKNSAGSRTMTALNALQCDARLLMTGTAHCIMLP